MKDLSTINFDTMTVTEFEEYLPELFAQSSSEHGGGISTDPRFTKFFAANPLCAELVRDLETIASTAKGLFEPHDPSDAVWEKIAGQLSTEAPKAE